MSFEEFQNRRGSTSSVRLETGKSGNSKRRAGNSDRRRKTSSPNATALHEAFALSLQPAKSSDALKERLMKMVRERKQGGTTAPKIRRLVFVRRFTA